MSEVLDIHPGDRILVSRTDRLGDLILALPFVETLKVRYPKCRVDVLASLYASPILENNDRIGGIVRVQNDQLASSSHYKLDLEQKIRKAHYRVVVVLYPQRQISRLLFRCGIPARLGTAGRFHSVYYSHRLLHSRKANKKHESEYNLDFLKFFSDGPTVTIPAVHPTERELANARRILGDAGITGPFIILHPSSGGSAERWPIDKFVRMYSDLEQIGLQVVVTGSESEGATISKVGKQHGTELNQITGKTDLRTLAAVLLLATTVVANSTGPLHLAVAVGTRVVGLYPSRKIMAPIRWGPVGMGHQVLQPTDQECKCPPGQCRCMETIEVSTVLKAVRKVYDGIAK